MKVLWQPCQHSTNANRDLFVCLSTINICYQSIRQEKNLLIRRCAYLHAVQQKARNCQESNRAMVSLEVIFTLDLFLQLPMAPRLCMLSCLWGLGLAEVAFYIIATLTMWEPSSLHYVTGNDTKPNTPPCPLKRTLREINTLRTLNRFSACLNINLSSYKNYLFNVCVLFCLGYSNRNIMDQVAWTINIYFSEFWSLRSLRVKHW